MLKFTGYFQEVVHEMPAEEYRIRKCIVYFYLEDDSIQVIEPRVENSGVPQGVCVTVCVCVRACISVCVRVLKLFSAVNGSHGLMHFVWR